MKHRRTFDRIQYQDGVVLAVLSFAHTYDMPKGKLSLATRLHGVYLTIHIYNKDDLNKRSAKHANKSTLVTRGADTQLGSS